MAKAKRNETGGLDEDDWGAEGFDTKDLFSNGKTSKKETQEADEDATTYSCGFDVVNEKKLLSATAFGRMLNLNYNEALYRLDREVEMGRIQRVKNQNNGRVYYTLDVIAISAHDPFNLTKGARGGER